MPSVRAFHSTRQPIHHRDETCASGRAIPAEDLRFGTGGKDMCPECVELARAKNADLRVEFRNIEASETSTAT